MPTRKEDNRVYAWHIPQDWDGATWDCCPLWYPDSPEWKAIVRGTLAHIARGRSWDRETGTITEAQRIGRLIGLAFDPSPEVAALPEVAEIMSCFDEVNTNLVRIAEAIEAGNAQLPPSSYPVDIDPALITAIELIATAVFPELGAIATVLGSLEELNP